MNVLKMLHCYDESIERNTSVAWHREREMPIQMLLRMRACDAWGQTCNCCI